MMVLGIRKTFLMDIYFRQTWRDPRLTFSIPGQKELSLSWIFMDLVWKPDTYFMNGKKSYLHRITVPNKFLRLNYDGSVVYSMSSTAEDGEIEVRMSVG
uniref:Neurotransmitter-gated ion-channel ligand-binding domain-containing protein n=1 Tax=Timema douglasi TaxID=61478 RepID=A0A7R8VK47_TIMDO|nr:unnamed protein product [Timema douglasi]